MGDGGWERFMACWPLMPPHSASRWMLVVNIPHEESGAGRGGETCGFQDLREEGRGLCPAENHPAPPPPSIRHPPFTPFASKENKIDFATISVVTRTG